MLTRLSYLTVSPIYPAANLRDAYERMLLFGARGDNSLFVGAGELVEAWRVFTPMLHAIDAGGQVHNPNSLVNPNWQVPIWCLVLLPPALFGRCLCNTRLAARIHLAV